MVQSNFCWEKKSVYLSVHMHICCIRQTHMGQHSNPASLIISCVTLDKLLKTFELQFPLFFLTWIQLFYQP